MLRSTFVRASNSHLSLLAASDFGNCLKVRNYVSDVEKLPDVPKPKRSGLQASYPRGTGGRLSFSGNVCTVFGASGYLGQYVVNSLAKDGTQIIVPYRGDPYDVRHLKTIGDLGQILFFPFYLNDEESIRKVVRYSNIVINLIGQDYPTVNFSITDVNANAARRIARICREMNVRRLIHFSALNASETPPEYFIPGGSEFLRSKALGEKYVRDEFPEATIVRPSDLFGWMDRFFNMYASRSRRSLGTRVQLFRRGLETFKGPVFTSNVADGVAQLVKDPTHDGKTFEFVGPHWYQLSDLVDWIYRLIHRSDPYYRRDIDFLFSFKCNIRVYMQWLSRRKAPYNWDQIETKEVTSDELTGCPTLEDLGVPLSVVEEKFSHSHLLLMHDPSRCYKPMLGEYPEPPWPRRYAPLHKKRDFKYSEKYETVSRPIVQAAV